MKYIIGIGEILWDIYPDCKYLGGAVSNCIFHLKQLGFSPVLITRIGKDDFGDEILKIMEDKGMNMDYIQIDKKRSTGTVRVTLTEKGNPIFNCQKNAAFDYLTWEDSLKDFSEKSDVVVFGSFAERNEISKNTILKFVQESKNAVKICDLNLRQQTHKNLGLITKLCTYSDVLKLNNSEFSVIKKHFKKEDEPESEFIDRFLCEFGISILLITIGEKGAAIFSDKERYYEPGYSIKVVDTTGSGDAFTAGFIAEYIKGKPLAECIKFANLIASFVAVKKGAVPEFDIEDILIFKSKLSERNISRKYTKLTQNQLFRN